MIKEIITDTEFLSQKCEKITDMKKAREIVTDLIDTALNNNNDETSEKKCCGLAANQIGEKVRVVIAQMPGNKFRPFINPMIVSHSSKTIDSTEGCMSLEGTRTVKRYTSVTVMYQNLSGKWNKETFTNFTAIELQHEIDHTNGILI